MLLGCSVYYAIVSCTNWLSFSFSSFLLCSGEFPFGFERGETENGASCVEQPNAYRSSVKTSCLDDELHTLAEWGNWSNRETNRKTSKVWSKRDCSSGDWSSKVKSMKSLAPAQQNSNRMQRTITLQIRFAVVPIGRR